VKGSLRSLPGSLTVRVGGSLLVLALVALLILSASLYLSGRLEKDGMAVDFAGSERMRAYKLSALAHTSMRGPDGEAGDHRAQRRSLIEEEMRRFEAILAGLRDGSTELGLPAAPTAEILAHIDTASRRWQTVMKPALRAALEAASIEEAGKNLADYETRLPEFVRLIDEIVQGLATHSSRKVEHVRRAGYLLFVVLLVVGGGTGYLLHRFVVGPLLEVAAAAKAMSGGDLSRRASVMPSPFVSREVAELTKAFNEMAARIEASHAALSVQQTRLTQIFDSTSDGIVLVSRADEIQAVNRRAGELLGFNADEAVGIGLNELLAGYRSSVPDYDRVLASIHAALEDPDRGDEGDLDLRRMGRIIHWVGRPTKDAAGRTVGLTLTLRDVTQERQVAQMKTDFVSFVTHQLRTPLAGIKWMLELVEPAPGIPEEPMGYVQDARQAAERLIGLVNDLLDVSRLESGKLKVNAEPVRLGELTQSVLDDLVTLVREKGHRLSVEGAHRILPVVADPQLLRQVVLNLTSNAIKYTPPGGDVTIRMDVENGAVRWAITDSGIGIPVASQARLFEKFYRADNAETVETEGTGLGLYLVRLILEKFAGQAWCESEEGRGSTFIFTLPVSGRGQ
jgi:PAS domain S-box-containing protein